MPAEARAKKSDDGGRYGGAEGGAGGIDSDDQGPVPGRKPLGRGFGCGGVVAGFAHAEEKAEAAEHEGAPAERSEHVGDGPPDDEDRHADARAEPIGNAARHQVTQRVGQEKCLHDIAVLEV